MTRWLGLGLLLLVYLFNFLDRTLFFVLMPLMKKEMTFSDLELALLGSTSFVIFYTLMGVPFGRLADRASRTKMIAVGLVVWSVFSGLTGFANDFPTIFGCRVMVGVGEATLGPAAMSLIADWFEPRRRATVQSLFTMGIPLGAASAFFLGGWVGAEWGWRTAFYWLGFPGVLLAVALFVLREPARGAADAGAPGKASGGSLREDLRTILSVPALRLHLAGYACVAVAANAISMWIPSLFTRAYGGNLLEVSRMQALATGLAGGLATAVGGALADRFRRRHRGGRMTFTALTSLLTAAAWLVVLQAGAPWAREVALFCVAGLGLIWLGPAAADVTELVEPRLRGLGIAVYYLVVNVLGYGLAPPAIGALSDALGSAKDPSQLQVALLVCPAACVVGAALLWAGRRALGRSTSTDRPA